MAFEYDRVKRFATTKPKFVYFFNSSIILGPIKAASKNSEIRGSSIGPALFVSCCVKSVSIHIITRK